MNLYRLLLGLVFSMMLSGCVTVGPFVTSVTNDGKGGLTIEKCTLSFGEFFSAPETRACETSQIVEVGR